MNGNTSLPTGTVIGKVVRLKTEKGFGFLQGPGQTQYFFHRSALQGSKFEDLKEGDPVTFLPGESEEGKGPRAEDVRRV